MHSTIERRLANCQINVPADYTQIFSSARISPTPYRVNYLDHTFFKDYSRLSYYLSIRPGCAAGDPAVTDIVALCYMSNATIMCKLSFDEEWTSLSLRQSRRRKHTNHALEAEGLLPLYLSNRPIITIFMTIFLILVLL